MDEGTQERHKARGYALRLLGFRSRTRRELEERIARRGYPRCIVDEVIGELVEEGYIDDARFAREWIDMRLRLKPMGKPRLRMELMEKGIDRGIIDEEIEKAFVDVDETGLALELARERFGRLGDSGEREEEAAFRRLYGFLSRRGFSGATIQKVFRIIRNGKG